jgi:23S rRNA pseudouridine1911/1915/1917 synthase
MNRHINQGRIYKCGGIVPVTTTLMEHLTTHSFQGFKEPAWKRRILRGELFVDDERACQVHHPLARGSRVTYHRGPWVEAELSEPLEILYRDEHVIALNKPSGLPTMPSQTFFEYTVLRVLRTSLTDTLAPPQPVHRLGVGTSGVLLVATSLPARKRLSCAIRDRKVEKVYRALVHGANIADDLVARIDCPIGPVPFPIGEGTIFAACPPKEGKSSGKSSLSLVRVVRRNWEADQAVVEVEIPTGRPHQIRIHMAYVGHPLVGDPLYLSGGMPSRANQLFPRKSEEGEEDKDTDDEDNGEEDTEMRVPLPRDIGYSLHAHRITFEHPTIDGKWMTITAPAPENLA